MVCIFRVDFFTTIPLTRCDNVSIRVYAVPILLESGKLQIISGSGSARISQNISAGNPRCTKTRVAELDVTLGGADYFFKYLI